MFCAKLDMPAPFARDCAVGRPGAPAMGPKPHWEPLPAAGGSARIPQALGWRGGAAPSFPFCILPAPMGAPRPAGFC